jgi:methyl-accepting chemotaxis protein
VKQQLGEVGIGPRLAAAFIAVAFLTLASGIIGLLGFWQASTAARILVENTEMIRTVQEIRATVGPLLGPPGDYILTRDPSAAGRYAQLIDQVSASINTYEQAHQAHNHSTEHSLSAAALISSTRADIVQLNLLGDALFATGDNNQALNLLDEMEALLLEANERLTALLVNAEEDILSARNAHAIAQRNAYIGLTVSALCAFSLAVGLAFFFTRSISKPLTELADATDRIIEGDLSTPIIVEASGEIDRLAKSFERMRLTLVRERGQVRLLAVLEERDRIGREMHDGRPRPYKNSLERDKPTRQHNNFNS